MEIEKEKFNEEPFKKYIKLLTEYGFEKVEENNFFQRYVLRIKDFVISVSIYEGKSLCFETGYFVNLTEEFTTLKTATMSDFTIEKLDKIVNHFILAFKLINTI